MKHWRLFLAGVGGAAALITIAGAAWVNSLGPPPLGKHLEYSHVVLDRDGRLLRAYQGRALAAAGNSAKCRPAVFETALCL
jgi:hypothetical protein